MKEFAVEVLHSNAAIVSVRVQTRVFLCKKRSAVQRWKKVLHCSAAVSSLQVTAKGCNVLFNYT